VTLRPGIASSIAVLIAAAASLLAGAARAAERIAYLAASDAYWQVWIVPAAGGTPHQVTRSAYEKARCSWFPDARHLLVNALDGRVFRVDAETGAEQEIPMPLRSATDAVVSPDGAHIAFSLSTADSIDDNEIWVVGGNGANPQRLTTMPFLQHDPQWSADGRWIYFLSGDGQQAHDIWRVAVQSRSTEQLTAGTGYHFELAIAADGRLAFSSNRSGDYEIYVQQDGRPVAPLTRTAGLDGAPSWSPDGKRLAFHSTRRGALNVWAMSADGSTPVQLTHHERGARNPVWSPAPQGATP
jgi:Tol biopolymer transport system component